MLLISITRQRKNFDVLFFNFVFLLCRYIIGSTAWDVAFPCHFHLIEIHKIVLSKRTESSRGSISVIENEVSTIPL